MKVTALASGSSGNCFYIGHENTGVLIDAGISAKNIRERLHSLRCDPAQIKGIFITHEHIDHVRGVDVFARQFNIPIFATRETIRNCRLCSNDSLIVPIKNNERVRLGKLMIEAFPKSHAAADPVSYTVSADKRVSVITDVGYLCKEVIKHVSSADFLFLESNHDVAMLEQGPYPAFLKAWIQSDEGHLSNRQAALGILEHADMKLCHIILSHLSQTNNTPQRALGTFTSILKERKNFQPKVSISTKECPTALFQV